MPADHPAVVERLVFTGTRKDFAALTARGLLLYMPTFGFNRFWLKTDQRRFFWLNTTLGGDSFEYRGMPTELVIGFLFAIGIYMPLALGYSLLGLYAETFQSYASVPFFLLTFAFGHYASFRARRYRLTRTGFRGIRFWMRGSGWALGGRAIVYLAGTAATAGIAWPWMQASLERYKMQHSFYGEQRGDFAGTGWMLAKAFLFPGIVVIFACTVFLALAVIAINASQLEPGLPVLLVIFAGLLIVLSSAWSVVTAVRTRWWISGLRFGDLRADNGLRPFSLVWPAIKAGALVALFLTLWFGLPALGVVMFVGSHALDGWLSASYGRAILSTLWALGGLVIVMFIKSVFYNYDFARLVSETTTITAFDTVSSVRADGTIASATGEGLADALGADGF